MRKKVSNFYFYEAVLSVAFWYTYADNIYNIKGFLEKMPLSFM